MKHNLKLIVFACLSIIMSLTILCAISEIVLRFFPVNEGLHSMPVNQHFPVLKFEPNRTSVWSRSWNFSAKNIIKTNNYGFVSNIDYKPNLDTPLIALIGDSYVVAARIPWKQTGAARLQEQAGSRFRVYAFAAAGAPLSQYLVYAAYACREFHPDRLIILIIANDFDESLMKYKRTPGFHHFIENGDELLLKRVDYEIKLWRALVRKSALGMYLATNINILQAFTNLKSIVTRDKLVGDTLARADVDRIADSQRAVDTFLKMLPEMSSLNPSHILFVVDGIRPQMYDKEELALAQGSYYNIIRQYFIEKAEKKGFEVIDMHPIFLEHYQKHGQRFEFFDDRHWNSLGHEVFANAVAKRYDIQ